MNQKQIHIIEVLKMTIALFLIIVEFIALFMMVSLGFYIEGMAFIIFGLIYFDYIRVIRMELKKQNWYEDDKKEVVL